MPNDKAYKSVYFLEVALYYTLQVTVLRSASHERVSFSSVNATVMHAIPNFFAARLTDKCSRSFFTHRQVNVDIHVSP